MPMVGGKKFAYTKSGKAKAKKPISRGGARRSDPA